VSGLLYEELTGKVLKAFFEVYNALGYGFSEGVYENSLVIVLKRLGLRVAQQDGIKVRFEGRVVGLYRPDLVVDDKVVLEIKAASTLTNRDEAQLLSYLTATPFEVGMLLNFGPHPQFRRRILHNHLKRSVKIRGNP
jgi:GxxExxY protein